MRGFLKFAARAIQTSPATTIGGIITTVAGVNYQQWLAAIAEMPPWWLSNRGIQLAVISIGIFVLIYVFYSQLENERGDTAAMQRLRLQPVASFAEISQAVAEAHPAYSREEILHRLMKALWSGEFEERSGHSRVRLKIDRLNSESGVVLRPLWHRRDLLLASDVDHWLPPKSREMTVRKFNKAVDFAEFGKRKHWPEDYLSTYIEPLEID